MPRQMLIECSEPGVVIASAEGVEHALRQVGWDDVLRLKALLGDLAREIGPDMARVWEGFKIEVPNEAGWSRKVPAFGTRIEVGQEAVGVAKRLAEVAGKRGYGRFEAGGTLLMSQSERPETRDQYIADLADAVRDLWTDALLEDVYWAQEEVEQKAEGVGSPRRRLDAIETGAAEDGVRFRIYSRPIPLPSPIRDYRVRLAREIGGSALAALARRAEVGQRWSTHAREASTKAVDEIGRRVDAVVEYELEQRDPATVPPVERLPWLALAVRTGQLMEKWYSTVESLLSHPSQKASLAHLLAEENEGGRRVENFMCMKVEAAIVEAEKVYTPEGVAALGKLLKDTRKAEDQPSPAGGV